MSCKIKCDPKLVAKIEIEKKISNTAPTENASNASSEKGDKLCDICFDNPKNTAFIPCGHVRWDFIT